MFCYGIVFYCNFAAVGTEVFTLSSLILNLLIWAALFVMNCLIISTLRNRVFHHSDQYKLTKSGTSYGEDNSSFKTDEDHNDDRAGAVAINNIDNDTAAGLKRSTHDSHVSAKNGL